MLVSQAFSRQIALKNILFIYFKTRKSVATKSQEAEVGWSLGYQPGEVSLLLELLLHFAANNADSLVDFTDLGEEGSDLVATEKTCCPSLQQMS